VFLPGFQKGRDIEAKEKGREQFWQKKGQFASYKEKLEKWTEFTTFRVNKMFNGTGTTRKCSFRAFQ
jgi:hypothetical protein